MINKDTETNIICMDIFFKKLILEEVFHLTLVTPDNVKAIYLLHLLNLHHSGKQRT